MPLGFFIFSSSRSLLPLKQPMVMYSSLPVPSTVPHTVSQPSVSCITLSARCLTCGSRATMPVLGWVSFRSEK